MREGQRNDLRYGKSAYVWKLSNYCSISSHNQPDSIPLEYSLLLMEWKEKLKNKIILNFKKENLFSRVLFSVLILNSNRVLYFHYRISSTFKCINIKIECKKSTFRLNLHTNRQVFELLNRVVVTQCDVYTLGQLYCGPKI